MKRIGLTFVLLLLLVCVANAKELDISKAYCQAVGGKAEYRLPDQSRVDCLTDIYAIEVEWAYKWPEAIGQSLYYAKMTGRKPKILLLVKSLKDIKYVNRLLKAVQGMEIAIELKYVP